MANLIINIGIYITPRSVKTNQRRVICVANIMLNVHKNRYFINRKNNSQKITGISRGWPTQTCRTQVMDSLPSTAHRWSPAGSYPEDVQTNMKSCIDVSALSQLEHDLHLLTSYNTKVSNYRFNFQAFDFGRWEWNLFLSLRKSTTLAIVIQM